MSAKRLVPLRHRGTEEQRYARLQKAIRRGSPLPRVGINYHGLWLRRWKREKRRPLPEFVDVSVQVGDIDIGIDIFADDKIAFSDDGIDVVRKAVVNALLTHQGEWFLEPSLGIPLPETGACT